MGKKTKKWAVVRASLLADRRWCALLLHPDDGQSDGFMELADRRKEDFLGCSEDDIDRNRRIYCLDQWQLYMHLAAKEHKNVGPKFFSKAHKRFANLLCANEQELSFVRATGCMVLGLWHGCNLECEYAAHCFIEASKLCRHASLAEKQLDLGFMKDLSRPSPCEKLSDLLQQAEDSCLVGLQAALQSNPSYLLSRAGGYICDVCNKPNPDILERLGSCHRCKLTFYCSEECRKEDWKSHKMVCRKRHEFRAGDLVYFANPDGVHKYGSIVKIERPGLAAEGPSWIVSADAIPGLMQSVNYFKEQVLAKDIRRIRPALWPKIMCATAVFEAAIREK